MDGGSGVRTESDQRSRLVAVSRSGEDIRSGVRGANCLDRSGEDIRSGVRGADCLDRFEEVCL